MDITTDINSTDRQERHTVWKTSITKTELAELPAEIYTGKITVVDDEESRFRH